MNWDKFEVIPLNSSREEADTKRADALANRALLLETAKALFAEQGVEAVSMAAVAQTAGVGKGTLYRAFKNKGELCLALMDEDLRRFQDETLHIFRTRQEWSALDHLTNFLRRLVYFQENHAPLMCQVQEHRVLAQALDRPSMHGWFYWTIRRMLQQAQAGGELSARVDVAYLTGAILALLDPELFRYQRRQLGFSLDHISQQLQRFVLQGLG